jgi:Protein of unknown function (DUF2934)
MAKRAPQPDTEPKTRQKAARPARARTPKNGANGGLHLTPAPNEDDIRVRAYHRYLERGGVDGMDFDDWVAAEKDLNVAHN